MGKRKTLNLLLLVTSLFFIHHFTIAQTRISGLVIDKSNNPLYSVSVVLKNKENNSIVSYTYTDEKGNYIISVEKVGSYNLTFSSLGLEKKVVDIRIEPSQKGLKINVELQDNPFELKEIVVKAELPMTVKEDTISFKVKHFTRGNEQTVEDLLKTIPGLSVDENGTIKIGDQEIEKLMIDGDDLFEKGYKILSKNMPAYPIEVVEFLKNYSNNRLLKGIEESNKVAVNLKLNEKSKRVWFGNLEVGIGNDYFYDFRGNLMNFGKKNKFYFLSNLNNIGYDATGDIEYLIRPSRRNEPSSLGDDQQVEDAVSLTGLVLDFKIDRTNFNNAELTSLNAIFNPSEKIKIKTLGFFNWDEINFFKNSINTVDIGGGGSFVNVENFQLRKKNRIGFGKLDLTYDISENEILESITKYNEGSNDGRNNLLFNNLSVIENLESNNTLFDQKIKYSNKFKERKVFLLTGRYIDEKTPQNYRVNQFFYEDIFNVAGNPNNVDQKIKNEMQFFGVNTHLLDRKENGSLLEFQFGNELRKDKLLTRFSIKEDEFVLEEPLNYQNQTTYNVNDLYIKAKYLWNINDFGIVSKFEVHQLFNELKNINFSDRQNYFFVNPSLGFNWKINDKNKIITTYSYNTTNAKVLDVFSDFIFTGFRSFSKGINSFNQLSSSNIFFNYQLGNWSDRFFINTFILYSQNHDFFSTNTLLNQNVQQLEKILIEDREFININTKLDYYFNFISSNLKLDISYTKNQFKNIVNNSSLREITSSNYNYAFELRSGFEGFFNYHFGTKWITTKINATIENSFTNNVSFLDLTFVFNKKLSVDLKSERYFFGNLPSNNVYSFLDFDVRYKMMKNKLTLALRGNNLTNTENFRSFSISDIGTSTEEYRLLPRSILLKIEYRF
ncbi:MAG: carboxypeptidase-like regulatory domain-containing protein [Flavobacteriaceae bacterium]